MVLFESVQKFLDVPPREWIYLVSVFVGMLLLIGVAEVFRKRLKLSPEVTRKFVHISIGVLIVFAPKIFVSIVPPLILGVLFIIVDAVAIRLGLLTGIHDTTRKSYGTVFYPIAFVTLVVLFWYNHPVILSLSMLVLALGDAGAAIIGENMKSPSVYRLTSDKKSIEGSSVMMGISCLCLFGGINILWGKEITFVNSLQIALVGSVIATGWEAISSKGFDNFTVPISTAFILYYYLVPSPMGNPSQFSVGIILSILIAIISFYFKFLTASGSVATFLLASIIFGVGGWKWTVPILTFFILSSLLSKIGRKRKMQFDTVFEKSSRRDYAQVTANGGIGGLIILLQYFYPTQDFYLIYLGSIAAVTADTWGTEIGLLKNFRTYSMTKFSQVAQGSNGGVSLIGFVGGFIGSFLCSLTAIFWVKSLSTILFVSIAGLMGGLIDSLLGDTIQVLYRCQICLKKTEKRIHCNKTTVYESGILWLNNDVVNWICAISGAIVAGIIVVYRG